MSSTDIEPITPPSQHRAPVPASTQATAIEQSRAVAEVQAAVVVAQQVPRDMGAAEADMRDACSRAGLANRAFYSVPNRGTGPSVHLARELARIFGNVQYGVHELRRDDALGMSEIQAFAWDVEKNVRSTRTFQVPHQRMKKINGRQTRDPLVDLTDVYLNNQNIGARAVRECIFTVLPAWLTDAAQDLCHKTLAEGEGEPLVDRVANMVRLFGEIGIKVDQLEEKIGRKRSAWQPIDLAQMTIVYTSIQRGEITKDDAFPARRITADEVMSAEQQPDTKLVSTPDRPTPESQRDNRPKNVPADVTPEPRPRPPEGETTGPAQAPPDAGAGPVEQQQDQSEEPAAPAPDQADTEDSGEAAEVSTGRATGPQLTAGQRASVIMHFTRLDVDDRDERLWWTNHFLELEEGTIGSTNELRQAEAVKILARLERFKDRDQLDASLNQDQLIPND